MNVRAAFNRVAQSAPLRFLAGSVAYGAYIESNEVIIANTGAALFVLGMNILSDRSHRLAIGVNSIVNWVTASFVMSEAYTQIATQGMTIESWGKLMIGSAYLSWGTADAMLLRMGIKNIETADKKYLDPVIPNGIADVVATTSFPPLAITSAAAIFKQLKSTPIAEDAPVHNKSEWREKHMTGNRYLAAGMVATGIAGVALGFGPAYLVAFSLWAAGYIGFEPKRNKAFVKDWKMLPSPSQ